MILLYKLLWQQSDTLVGLHTFYTLTIYLTVYQFVQKINYNSQFFLHTCACYSWTLERCVARSSCSFQVSIAQIYLRKQPTQVSRESPIACPENLIMDFSSHSCRTPRILNVTRIYDNFPKSNQASTSQGKTMSRNIMVCQLKKKDILDS